MALAYFDCFAGAGGDMIVAALVDAGADGEAIAASLAEVDGLGVRITFETVHRQGIAATHMNVTVEDPDPQHARHLADILDLASTLDAAPRAIVRIEQIFTRLADAEATIHGIDREHVHFHEVGAADSISDIFAAAMAMEQLNVNRVACSPIPVGHGRVTCDHGTLPVPAPATLELLRGFQTCGGEIAGETTTPTAAAVLTTLAEAASPAPPMTVSAIGYGAGTRDGEQMPNVLRVVLGDNDADGRSDSAVELSANIDDTSGEVIGAAIDAMLAAGALDVWATPAVMKKSRPAWGLSALCRPADVERIESLFFSETTTFGVRRRMCARTKLLRRFETVSTPYGPVRVKVGRDNDRDVTACAEFDDCLRAARAHNVSPRLVTRIAEQAFWQDHV